MASPLFLRERVRVRVSRPYAARFPVRVGGHLSSRAAPSAGVRQGTTTVRETARNAWGFFAQAGYLVNAHACPTTHYASRRRLCTQVRTLPPPVSPDTVHPTGLTLLRRLASLVPPPRVNLTRFHGVFASGVKVRPFLLPQAGEEPGLEEESPAFAATVEEPRKERTPRLDWAGLRRTFALDVFACLRCGGRRRVLASVKGAGGVSAIVEHLGLPTASAHLAPARAPP